MPVSRALPLLAALLLVGCPKASPIPGAAPEPTASEAAAASPRYLPLPVDGFVGEGMPFEPRMAYVVGPYHDDRATLLVTAEEPHTDCGRAEAARAGEHLEIRVFYASTGSTRFDAPRPWTAEWNAGTGTGAWLVTDGAGTPLVGSVAFQGTPEDGEAAAPDTAGAHADVALALSDGTHRVSGHVHPLVCFTEQDLLDNR